MDDVIIFISMVDYTDANRVFSILRESILSSYNFLGDEPVHKIFISYHHNNDQVYKKKLLTLNNMHDIFLDCSVDTGDIDGGLDDAAIREIIRDERLRDSTVTILLAGTETRKRKHVDWEIYSSMYDGKVNKKSGVLVVNLPTVNCTYYTATHVDEKKVVYPDTTNWMLIDSRTEYESRYPHMPARIIDNLVKTEGKISVVDWSRIENDPDILSFLIDATFNDRTKCVYDLSRSMRRANS